MKKIYFALAANITFLLGCAGPLYNDPVNPPLNLAGITEESLSETFQNEMLYQGDNAAKRRIGLALSGGGSKAGLFAHGILHGLNETGLLQKIDVISATSGGNYPTYWYFTKHIEAQKYHFDISQIFDDCVPAWYGNPTYNHSYIYANVHQAVRLAEKEGQPVCTKPAHFLNDEQGNDRLRWQAHLAGRPDLFETRITELNGDKQSAPWYDTLWLGLRLFGELPLSYLPIDSGIPLAYMRGIERTWGLNPEPRTSENEMWEYSNSDQTFFGALHVNQKSVTWESLQELYSQKPTLPLWVMNTTQGQKTDTPNMYNLYEITPFSYGSARHGYHNGTPPINSISYGVRASAAFFDKQGAVGTGEKIIGLLNPFFPATTWGVRITQPVPPSLDEQIRLSDGGGADNLGLMSLLRRGLDQIIVVDAAQDVEGRMKDLCWVRSSLQDEGYNLTLPALENLDSVCDGKKAFNVSEWKNPVITGEIIPMKGVKVGVLKHVKLFWIKAAWNEYAIRDVANDQYPYNDKDEIGWVNTQIGKTDYMGKCGNEKDMINCWLPVFYAHNAGPKINGPECLKSRERRGVPKDDCFIDFPQLETVGSTFYNSSYLFWAFRELGRSAALRVELNERGELTTDITQCIQLAKDKRHGRRPNDWDAKSWKENEKMCVQPIILEN